ncbi:hypothetical protein GGS21DRAFT_504871 [Xylaria nigripes]|nr:hypothetical protein GGS21DRAFT_504871 [Xylaria nigripes]
MKIVQNLTVALAVAFTPFAVADGTGSDNAPPPPHDLKVPPPGPVQKGALIDICGVWVVADPGMTCISMAQKLEMEVSLFMALNPPLKEGCEENLWAGYSYCTAIARRRRPGGFWWLTHIL